MVYNIFFQKLYNNHIYFHNLHLKKLKNCLVLYHYVYNQVYNDWVHVNV